MSRFFLGVLAAALFTVVAVPHVHANDQAPHHPQAACRICKIHNEFSAKSPDASAIQLAAPAMVDALHVVASAAIFSPAVSSASPRAPPVRS